MAATIPSDCTDTISLREFVEFCESHPELQEREFAIENADRLRALANDKRFLTAWLNEELEDVFNFQERNDFEPPTFVLHNGGWFTVRAVVWLPLDARLMSPSMFSYFEAHDHRFDFLTCGYHGPGYRTVVYRYDYDSIAGYPGEPVDLEFVEDTHLTESKLMYYYASRDIHIQHPPESLSISLNLILPRPKAQRRRQYWFDVENRRIAEHFGDMPMRRALFAAARSIGDGDSDELLLALGTRHGAARTRALALETLMARHPARREELQRVAAADASAYVRACATGDGGARVGQLQ
ncbi:MAG TPA: hypothetical protein VF712_15035 [Thermoleophilaceae bacterium]|jgi:hypothetical protein